ncbi:YqaJ viral recombinase family protein [Vagococcus sp. PNs007]|uniref:YqaJ viral recombinase family protein n=1 Tax=Vagococcus proximus TaxID=2991417 RepID=A0ABT5X2L8_9ENTE|nr:YqaJ viral recombinase family protein [Vagococcus proximus]MDF0480248.1 YqaJ viral recombinase family protein [Vagococcus proximus]
MNHAIKTVDMTREEWLADRQKGLGGSDVATVLGLNKYKSAFQLWLEKIGEFVPGELESEAAYWGTELEEVVAKEFSFRTDKKVRRRNMVFEHPNYPFLRANIDRDVVGENAILECKTASAYLAKDWEDDEIPAQYICQVQHYMNVLDCEFAYIAVLIGGQRFVWKRIERDQELIDIIIQRCTEFWQVNVCQNVAPPVDGSNAANEFLRQEYGELACKEATLSERVDGYVETRRSLKASEKEIKTAIKEMENNIILELGKVDAEIGITPNNVITFKAQTRKSLNKDLLKEKYPQVANDDGIYKVTELRVLRDKEI